MFAQAGVGFAVLTGCPYKKCWVGADQPPPQHHLYDDGDLYHYSGTDGLLTSDLKAAYDKVRTAARMKDERSLVRAAQRLRVLQSRKWPSLYPPSLPAGRA